MFGVPSTAAACVPVPIGAAEPDESLVDDSPPTGIGDVEVVIERGRGPVCDEDGICEITSCDDIGMIQLAFEAPTDDQTTSERMAFSIEVIEGEPVALPPWDAFRTGRGDSIPLHWGDEATDDQEPIDFTIVLRAVDEAGNVGPASAPIVISDLGSTATEDEPDMDQSEEADMESGIGCRVGGGGGGLLMLLPLVALARRRRLGLPA